jgi:hypothetical protein
MPVGLDLPGPEYWCTRNALCTASEFQDAVQGFMPALGYGPLSDQGATAAYFAYQQPFSPEGLYAQAVLGNEKFGPSDPAQRSAILSQLR